MKRLLALMLSILLLAGCAPAVYDGPTKGIWVLTEQISTEYDAFYDGGIIHRTTFAYDSFGNQVHTLLYLDGTLTSEYRYRYDDRGNRTSAVHWDHGPLISLPDSRTSYTYDGQNRLLTTTYRNGLGIKTSSDTYTYNDEANTITWTGTYDTQTKYLNENGDLLRTVSFSEPAQLEIETRYEYDALGRNIKIVSYQNGVLSETMELCYDDQDRLLEYIYREIDGTVLIHETRHYEDNTVTTWDLEGNKTIETLRPDGQVEKMEQYDDLGNRTLVTEYIYQEIQVPADREE